jgi:oligopeptide/dipeptide ABC transporter ATP-binding protein
MTSLNPVMTVGDQVAESLRIHRGLSRAAALDRARALFEEVKIPSAAQRLREYPHQFSGGMRQRVMIAMALACEPAVLLADEPTTALDVTIQAQVLGLLADLRRKHGMAVLFITHNLGVVAQIADRVAVMYAGEIVEQGPVGRIFAAPAHPYTRALFAAIPRLDQPGQQLSAIPGRVPPLDAMPAGCRFAPRCPLRRAGCEQEQVLAPLAPDQLARCHVATGALAMEGEGAHA